MLNEKVTVVAGDPGRIDLASALEVARGFRLTLARSALAAAVASLLPLYGAAAQVGQGAARQSEEGKHAEGQETDSKSYSQDDVDPPKKAAPPPPAATELEKITVTGTRIRGGTTPSPVITIGSENIREEGFADLGEVVRSVPQNFAGGQNPGVASGATDATRANANLDGASSLNLRGLGPDASLTLLNGRRMAYGGYQQAIDIGTIPVEAVQRIEIVPDGASAIYGSDAVGGVANVILKRDFEGVALSARRGHATEGGLSTREYAVTTGGHWRGGGLIAAYKDISVDPVYADQRWYTRQMPAPTMIYPGSHQKSGVLSMYQSLGEIAELRVDALASRRSQDYKTFFSSRPIYDNFLSKNSALLLSPALDVFLPNDWTLSLGGTRSHNDADLLLLDVAVATGQASLRTHECACNDLRSYEVSAEGPLVALPAGDLRLAVGTGYRRHGFRYVNLVNGASIVDASEANRYSYAEANVPLLGAVPESTARRLALTAAVRQEDYDSLGSVTTPRGGLVYTPGDAFTWKASWGRSFKAPTLFQSRGPRNALLVPPALVGGSGYGVGATVLLRTQGNPELEAERALTRTVSVAFHPQAVPGMELELTWFRIHYVDRVVQPINNLSRTLVDPANAPFVQYAPTQQMLDEVLANATFFNLTGAAYNPANVVAIVRAEYTNVAAQEIDGVDLSGSYATALGPGRLSVRGAVSWLDSTQRVSPAAPTFDMAGTLFSPAKVNARIGGAWSMDALSLSLFGNYRSGVSDRVTGARTASFTTFDATARYRLAESAGFLSGLELAVSAQNILNREPPLHKPRLVIFVPYDSTNYSGLGRFLSVSLTKHF